MGGLSSAYITSVKALAQHGSSDLKCLIAVDRNSPEEAARVHELRNLNIDLHEVECSSPVGEYLANPRMIASLGRLIPTAQVVHVDGLYVLPNAVLAARRAVSRRRLPIVISPHETLTEFDKRQSKSRTTALLKPLWRRAVAPQCDAIVYSSTLEEQHSSEYSSVPSTVLSHVVEAAGLNVGTHWHRPPVLGFMGRLHPKKGLERLIDSVAVLKEQGIGAIVRIAGSGDPWYVAKLRQRVESRGLSNAVEWCGWLSSPLDVQTFYASIDALVMPSDFECFGLSAAEAAVEGIPVVVSSTTGMAEFVSRFALGAVSQPSVPDLAEALKTTIGCDVAPEGTMSFAEHVSAKSHAETLECVYRRVVAE